MAEQDLCPHLDSIGEVTKEDLLQKSKVGFNSFTVSVLHSVEDARCLDLHTPQGCYMTDVAAFCPPAFTVLITI